MGDDAAFAALNALDTGEQQLADLVSLLHGDAILARAAQAIHRAGFFDAGVVGRREGAVLTNKFVSGLDRSPVHNLVLPVGAGLGGKVIATGRPMLVRDYAVETSISHEFDHVMGDEGLRSVFAVPVFDRDEPVAVLYAVRRTPAEFGSSAQRVVLDLASRASVAINIAEQSAREREARMAEDRAGRAFDLHDTVGQLLYSVGTLAQDLRLELKGDASLMRYLARAERIVEQASAASSALREALAGMTVDPAPVGLVSGMQAELTALTESSGIASRLVILRPLERPVPVAITEILLRCLREALHNVQKHAAATTVVLSCAMEEDGLRVSLQDDGGGFTEQSAPGLGIRSMTERVERIGGRMSVVDNDGGCAVRWWLPC